MPRLVFPLCVSCLLLVATGCPAGPKDATQEFYRAINAREYSVAFNMLSEQSQAFFEPDRAVAQALSEVKQIPDDDRRQQEVARVMASESHLSGKSWAEVDAMTAEEYFAALISQKQGEEAYGGEIVSESIDTDKDRATVKVRTRSGEEELDLVKEDGTWKVAVFDEA